MNLHERLLFERDWHELVAKRRDDNSLISDTYGFALFDAGVAGV